MRDCIIALEYIEIWCSDDNEKTRFHYNHSAPGSSSFKKVQFYYIMFNNKGLEYDRSFIMPGWVFSAIDFIRIESRVDINSGIALCRDCDQTDERINVSKEEHQKAVRKEDPTPLQAQRFLKSISIVPKS